MNELIAHKQIGDEELYFVLVEESYSDNDEPYTLFIQANHYSAHRIERARLFFYTTEDAFKHCQQQHGISPDEWKNDVQFTENFQFKYGITNLGIAQPYLDEFQDGQTVFRLGKREGENGATSPVLNIGGNREGLRRLAAMLLLCANWEYDDNFHIHLEDEDGFILPDMSVTLLSPNYFEGLVRNELREGSVKATINPKSENEAA